MTAVGDVLRIKDFQSLQNIEGEVLNVYFYKIVSQTGAPVLNNMSAQIEAWMIAEFLPPILAAQTDGTLHVRVDIDNMMAFETEFVSVTYDESPQGVAVEQYASASAAWSFQLIRQLRTTRHGSKRIPGIPESYVSNNVATGSGVTATTNLAAHLGSQIELDTGTGIVMQLAPVIAKTPVFPATIPSVFNNVLSASYRGVGSQNSRKQLLP